MGVPLLALACLGACSDGEAEGDNQAPVIDPVTAEMDEDAVLELDVLSRVSDADGDKLSMFLLKTAGGHQVELRPGGKIAVTPLANFHGVIEIPFKVTDKHFTIPGTATVTVRSVNDAPQGTTSAVAAQEDTPTPFQLTGKDLEGDPLTFSLVEQPAHGTVSGTAPELIYTPAPDFAGGDVIRYQVSDGTATAVESLAVSVANVNDAPVVPEQPLAATEDVPLAFSLEATDADGDALSFFVTRPPQHGTLIGSGRSWTYQPAANYSGPDQLTLSVSDGRTSLQRVVPITVAPVDDAPTAAARFASSLEDHSLSILLVGADVDSDQLSYSLTSQPAHGTLSGTAPDLLYTPAADFNGSDTFTYVVTADGLSSAPATVSLSLSPVNDAPRPVNQTLTVLEDGSVSLVISAVDPDSSNLSYSNSTLPDDGYLLGTTGTNRTYYTQPNAHGTRTFTFSVFDGLARSYGTVTFLITPVNDPPVANVDFVATAVNEALDIPVLANDVDVDGEALVIDNIGEAAHGQVALAGDKLRYTPADGYSGTDQVTYRLIDAAGVTASAMVTVGIGEFPAGAPDEPLAFEVAHGGDSWSALSLSADGRFLVFSSTEPLVPQDTNTREDVYVYERGRRILRLASSTAAGMPGDAGSTNAQISGNGRYVVFESSSTNFVAASSSLSKVFRKDLVTGQVVQISVSSAGEAGNGDSWEPKISDDGNRVVFSSMAFNLGAGDGNGAADIFLRDVASGTTQRMSLSRTGSESDGESTTPVISGDGAVVAFVSKATNLIEGDSNGVGDVFVRDVAAMTTSRVSITTNGVQGDQHAEYPWLSRDGRYVSFVSFATNFGNYNPGYYSMVYVRDRVSETTIWNAYLTTWPQLSGDGRYLCGEDYDYWNAGAALIDRFAAATTFFSSDEGLLATALSSNGRYLAYAEILSGTLHIQPNPH